jgi:chromosome partitioning protein
MIVTFTSEGGVAEQRALAHRLAARRARSARRVLFVEGAPQFGAPPASPNLVWHCVGAQGLSQELENLMLRFPDIVIDAEGRDGLGSRSALIAARVAVVPIAADHCDALARTRLVQRLETARLFNPALRVLFVTPALAGQAALLADAARQLQAQVPASATIADTTGTTAPAGPFSDALIERLHGAAFGT